MDPQFVAVLAIAGVALGYLSLTIYHKLRGSANAGGSCPGCRKCAAAQRELPVLKGPGL